MFTWFTLLFNLPLIFGQIKISDENTEPLNDTGIRFSFRVRGNTNQLNGHFSVEHKDCSNRYCGQKVYSPPISDGNQIRIGTELSPCSDHFGLKIKAGKFDFAGGGVVVFRRDWKALVCNKTQIRNPFEETRSSVRTQTSNDTTDPTVNIHYDKITTISIAKKSENNTKEIEHKIKDNANNTTQNAVAKNNDKQIILVAFIASSITLVATLGVVFVVLFARRLWSKRTRAEVEKNPDYGFYYGSVLIFIWTRSIRFKSQNHFLYIFFSPDGERIDNGVVEMVDQNNYYENS